MKICRISQTYPTEQNNGIGLHTYNTSNLIPYPTLVLTRETKNRFLSRKSHVDLQTINFIQYPFPKDRKESPVRFLIALLAYGIGQIEFFLKSIPHLLRFKPTIVHLQSPHAILIGIFAKYVLGAKLVVTFHGSDLRRIKNNKPFLKLLRISDRIFYVAAPMHELLSKYFSEKQLVHTPSGIDLDFFLDFSKSKKSDIILSVGNLRWQKDYSTLLEALLLVFNKAPNYRAVIIGDGPEEESLKRKAASLGIANKVTFLGQQPKEIVRKHLYESSVFAMSSVTEGMPKAIIEALVTDIPVVATSVGAIPEILDGIGLVVEPKNPTALAEALFSATQGGISEEMVSRGKALALNYSWSHLAAILESEFTALTKANGIETIVPRSTDIQ